MTTQLNKEFEVTIDVAADLLEVLTDAGDVPMLWGKPGLGKSDIVRQLGARKGRKVIEFHAALREPVDLRGVPVPNHETGTTKWFVPDELPRVDRDGEFGYLFLDEMNQASAQMQAVLAGLILYGTVGDYTLPPGWRVIAAGNRVSDRAAAQRMPTHIRNRLSHVFIVPDVEAWAKWANVNGVAPELVAFVRLRRELIHVMPQGDENAFPTPRSLTKCGKYINAPKTIRLRLFAANIGDGAAAELDGFIELYRSLGSLDDIVANPDGAKLPDNSSERYAVSTGLGRIATRKNLPAIIKYAMRLPRENEILVVHDAALRDASLKNTSAYGAWAVRNADVIVQ
jgi:hypothetical protein